uniref:Uncharacterized protein n=1 Tax=Pseudictyota dubia TaxID=2749911 RepID=A0A7R9ZAP4_9STRA
MEDLKVWVYVQHDYTPADRSYPIKQSYVDIILRGCLSISEAFARSFIDTTVGWWHDGNGSSREKISNVDQLTEDKDKDDDHHTWIDDRHFPLYIRSDPDYSQEMGHILDSLIKEHHPEALERRKRY